jgi:glutamine phosphoribosylpyrophosphate amidotransferase
MDGVSVYEARLAMGDKLAQKILSTFPNHDIDVVVPIPDTSRTAGLHVFYCFAYNSKRDSFFSFTMCIHIE